MGAPFEPDDSANLLNPIILLYRRSFAAASVRGTAFFCQGCRRWMAANTVLSGLKNFKYSRPMHQILPLDIKIMLVIVSA